MQAEKEQGLSGDEHEQVISITAELELALRLEVKHRKWEHQPETLSTQQHIVLI